MSKTFSLPPPEPKLPERWIPRYDQQNDRTKPPAMFDARTITVLGAEIPLFIDRYMPEDTWEIRDLGTMGCNE